MKEKLNIEDARRLAEKFKSIKNRSEFARKYGVPGGSAMIYQHINGLRPISLKAAQIYAKGLNCSLDEISPSLADEARAIKSSLDNSTLLTAQEELSPYFIQRKVQAIDEQDNDLESVRIKRIKFNVEAGISGFQICQESDEGNPIYFRLNWLQSKGYKSENLIAVYVHGNSMEPGLYDGDTVIVNMADIEPIDGKVFVVNYEGEIVIKRLIRDAGLWWLSSDNPDQRKYPRKECSKHLCSIIGRVVHKQSEQI